VRTLPAEPGIYAIAALCCVLAGLLCLLAAAVTALAEHRRAPAVAPDQLAVTEDEQRSPEWCWTHGCHSSQCPGPH
jgi:hypothetical protein